MIIKHALLGAGLSALGWSGLGAAMRPSTKGLGAILMFHSVKPAQPREFDPHSGLEITPEFLDASLRHVKSRGYEIIPIGALADRLRQGADATPFVVLTFDDGYRDNLDHALPVLKEHEAPFAIYITTGFADGTAPLWWLDLAEILERDASLRSNRARRRAFRALMAEFSPRADLRSRVAAMAAAAGIDTGARTRSLCLDWDAIARLAEEPLCTIGAHTLTHPILAALGEADARREIIESKAEIESRLGRPVDHIAYPVGGAAAAGAREFAIAREAGFATAVTTRPGVLFPRHGQTMHALPRLSVNGMHQSVEALDALLSGAAFWFLEKAERFRSA